MDDHAIAARILALSRKELIVRMRYMDALLSFLEFTPGDELTSRIATDGEKLYFNIRFTEDLYLRGRPFVDRAYLHTVLHCMLRHLAKSRGRDPVLWDIACDAAVESIIDSLDIRALYTGPSPARKIFYDECLAEIPVLSAEGIYLRLLKLDLPQHELMRLSRSFIRDDHSLWSDSGSDGRMERQDRSWQEMAERTASLIETLPADEVTGGEAFTTEIRAAMRDDVDYRAFLRRFAAPREIMELDTDAFDYIYYTYGLSLYGNMPLVEPPETKEERRIEDFVIAVDTSMSTSGELVREFISATWSILRSTSTFTRRVHIRIIQCDNEVRSDTRITDLDELMDYMEHFTLSGGSSTDFRPVFARVDELLRAGEFSSLRGLIYFTDGMGIYPERPTPYETAFIFLEEPPLSMEVPVWATRITITVPELKKAREEAARLIAEEDKLIDYRTVVVPT